MLRGFQIKPGANGHLVRIADGVDIDQGGHWQLVGPGDLGERLPAPHGVLARPWSHLNRGRLRLGLSDHRVAGKLQCLSNLHVVGVAQAVHEHQIPAAHAVAGSDVAQGVAWLNPVAPWACTHPWTGDFKSAACFDVIGITQSVEAHELTGTDPVAVGNLRKRFTGLHRDRCGCGRQREKGR